MDQEGIDHGEGEGEVWVRREGTTVREKERCA